MSFLKAHHLKLTIVIIAFLQPIIILSFLGEIHSISSVWGTYLQPVFIFVNVVTSFYFFLSERWKISGLLLMLLTAFSLDIFPMIHNILAILFFVSVLFGFKRNYLYIAVYLLSTLLSLSVFNIFWAEFAAITVICVYHFYLILKLKRG